MTTSIDEAVILLALPDKYPLELYNVEEHKETWEEEVSGVPYILRKFRDSQEIDVYRRKGYTEDRKYARVSYVGTCECQLKKVLKERGHGEMFNFFNPPKNANARNQDVIEASE